MRTCDWCRGEIRAAARADAITCSKRCRQARHRFHRAVVPSGLETGRVVQIAEVRGDASRPARIAYADPPYPGLARRYYRDHPDYAGEVDHAALIRRLCSFDGWALSTSSAALPAVLACCPPSVRVAAWFRGPRVTPSAFPLRAWEPVLYVPARAIVTSNRDVDSRRVDALVHVARARTTDPARVVGSKSAAFIRWIFDLVGALPGDTFEDLFPGSGGVARAWSLYSSRRDLAVALEASAT